MKKILFLMLLCLPFIAMAQTDPKYLAGAITMDDGKVSFKTEIQAPSLTKDQLYGTMLKWATERFKPEGKFNARVLYTNEDEGTIAAGGEEYLVFSSSALSLDRTRIYYQLFITCENGKCDIEMTRIRYWYDEARDGGEKYSAEEWIVDDMALNKSKTKLAPICGKFRRETIERHTVQIHPRYIGQQGLEQLTNCSCSCSGRDSYSDIKCNNNRYRHSGNSPCPTGCHRWF